MKKILFALLLAGVASGNAIAQDLNFNFAVAPNIAFDPGGGFSLYLSDDNGSSWNLFDGGNGQMYLGYYVPDSSGDSFLEGTIRSSSFDGVQLTYSITLFDPAGGLDSTGFSLIGSLDPATVTGQLTDVNGTTVTIDNAQANGILGGGDINFDSSGEVTSPSMSVTTVPEPPPSSFFFTGLVCFGCYRVLRPIKRRFFRFRRSWTDSFDRWNHNYVGSPSPADKPRLILWLKKVGFGQSP